MKKPLLLLLMISSAFMVTSCKKLKEATEQNVSITPNSVEFNIDPIATTNTVTTIGTINVDIDLNALVKQYAAGFGVNNIKSIKIKSFKIDLVNGSDASNNLANLESLSGEISATGKSSQAIVNLNSNPDVQATSITIPSSGDIELKDFVAGTSVKYTLKGKLRRATTKTLRAKITAEYAFVFSL